MASSSQTASSPSSLFVHGLGVQTAEGWLSGYITSSGMLASRDAGATLLVGYPAVPEQQSIEGRAAARLGTIDMKITDGYAPVPEQSTLALIAITPGDLLRHAQGRSAGRLTRRRDQGIPPRSSLSPTSTTRSARRHRRS